MCRNPWLEVVLLGIVCNDSFDCFMYWKTGQSSKLYMKGLHFLPHREHSLCRLERCIAFLCKCFLRTMFVILNNVYCIPTYVVWMMIIFPLKRYHPDLYWKIEGHFFHWLLAMVSMWSWSAGYDIVELGDDIRTCLEDRTLVIANHQSTADVPLLMATFNTKKNVLPNLMWIMDRVFKYTNFGIVSILHEDFFIVSPLFDLYQNLFAVSVRSIALCLTAFLGSTYLSEEAFSQMKGKDKRGESLQALVKHLCDSYIPRRRKWMVLFPEGGFLRKRRETSQRFALKNNLPVLQHVSLPRVGALQTIVDTVGPEKNPGGHSSGDPTVNCDGVGVYPAHVNWVLDITIAYPEGKPLDLGAIVTGYRKPCKTFLFYRLFPCREVPRDHEAMTKWLYDRFVEKEKLLDAYYKTGKFPTDGFCASPVPPQEVSQDCLRFAILHLFFITSSYIHFQLLSYVVSYFWY